MKRVRLKTAVVFGAALMLFAGSIDARELKGVTFPDTDTIGTTPVKLVGLGLRKKLVINVYVGALYMEKPSGDAAAVISADQPKRVVLRFIYNGVGADDLTKAWTEGFEKNLADKGAALKTQIDTFKGFFTEGMKTGETISATYIPGTGTEVAVKGRVKGTIPGKDFMEGLFSVWFGKNPPSGDLKKGMLGG